MPIELKNISYTYKTNGTAGIPALHDISIKIGDGEFVGIMGRTGCGKTTLIQLMAGLLEPSSGVASLDGQDINNRQYDRKALRGCVSLVFQFPEYQIFETTVEKDVAFGLKHSGLKHADVKERVKWALETMGFSFDAVRSQPPLSLSGGEKRRVAIAGALVTKPRFLIFDEPIAGLDPLGRQSFLETVSSLNRGGAAVIMVSHNADALAEYAKRIILLDGGRLAADGPANEIFTDRGMLEALHLSTSAPGAIACMLTNRGIGMPQNITKYSELLGEIKKLYSAAGNANMQGRNNNNGGKTH